MEQEVCRPVRKLKPGRISQMEEASRPPPHLPSVLASGTYLGTQTVTISDATSGAAIFYTTDGSTPAASAGGSTLTYNGPITVTSTQTIRAIAKSSTLAASAVATANYVIEQRAAAPNFSPGPGTYVTGQSVSILPDTGRGHSLHH